MSNTLNDIADRLTPSNPMELTFAAQPVSTGVKIASLIGHMNASGYTALPYSYHDMSNVGDPDEAYAEVAALAGANSEIALMAKAFIKANSASGENRNYSAFRVVFLPYAATAFGDNDEALTSIKRIRSDMIVSCYAASSSSNLTKLQEFASLISGIDRNLQGQFGSFVVVASIDALATQIALAINNSNTIVASLPDTNTANITGVTGTTVEDSYELTDLTSVEGINVGATITGTGIPANTVVESVSVDSIVMSKAATADGSTIALSFQNVVSQNVSIIAAAFAGVLMNLKLPYKPVLGMKIGGLVAPQKNSDRIEIDPNGSSEQALNAGLSPLYVLPDESVGMVRSRTTYHLKADSVTAVTAYFDWQDLVILYDFRETCYYVTQNPPFNNNPGGTKLTSQIMALFKDEVLREAANFEEQGAFQNVKTLSKYFIVQASTTSMGRMDFKIPVQVVPGLMVIAGNIQAISDIDSYLLTTI